MWAGDQRPPLNNCTADVNVVHTSEGFQPPGISTLLTQVSVQSQGLITNNSILSVAREADSVLSTPDEHTAQHFPRESQKDKSERNAPVRKIILFLGLPTDFPTTGHICPHESLFSPLPYLSELIILRTKTKVIFPHETY